MSEVNRYVVTVDNSIAKFGRFLKKGEVIELEERQAHTDFAGRVALESDPTKPTVRWEESNQGLDAFERELKNAGLRAHERVQILEARKNLLSSQLGEVERMLEVANNDLAADTKKIQERHAQIAARQGSQTAPAPAVQPSAPPPAAPTPANE